VLIHDDCPDARLFFLQRSEYVDFHDDSGPADVPVRNLLSAFRRVRLAVHFCLLAAFIVGFFPLCVRAENTVTSRKHALSEKLDSVDLEKQLRKRRGESLEDLEKTAELLKDSIAIVKQQLPGISSEAQDSNGKNAVLGERAAGWVRPFQKFLPKTFIDWMVDIIGLIAIISGVVLIIGIFGLLSKKFNKKKKEAPLPRPLHEIFPRSYAADAYDRIPKVPSGPTEEKDETIASLRKRMVEAPEKAQRDEVAPPALDDSAAADGVTGKSRAPAADEDPRTLKAQVIRAAQQGLDVSEISRRFHLSSDQVSLILRIARTNDTGPH
jgi:hypothetical protein